MAFYGVGLEVKVKELLLHFKMNLQGKAPELGICRLRRNFKRFDASGNKKLDGGEFE
jgi:hypothetical protein